MTLERRDFLRYSSLGVAAGLLVNSPTHALALALDEDSGEPNEGWRRGLHRADGNPDWEAVRSRFAIDRSLIHMSGLFLASNPEPVAKAIREFREKLDANPVAAIRDNNTSAGNPRPAITRYTGAPATEIGLTTSTTMGIAIAIHGIKLKPGAEILYTTHEHSVTRGSIDFKVQHSGATTRQISLYPDDKPDTANEPEVLERLRAGISAETRVFASTWVHSKNGVKLPIAAMSRVIDEINAARDEADRVIFVVDGVHGFGIENVNLPDLGCDLFAAGTHKWIFGPRGTGLLWGNPRVHERMTPVIPSLGGGSGWGGRMTPGGFQAFEHRWAVGQAFEFHMEIGKPEIQTRIHALNTALKEGLRGLPRVTLRTPMSPAMSSGMACFDVEGVTTSQVVSRLLADHKIIATTTPYSPSHARLTPGLLNDMADVEACIRAVMALAT